MTESAVGGSCHAKNTSGYGYRASALPIGRMSASSAPAVGPSRSSDVSIICCAPRISRVSAATRRFTAASARRDATCPAACSHSGNRAIANPDEHGR